MKDVAFEKAFAGRYFRVQTDDEYFKVIERQEGDYD